MAFSAADFLAELSEERRKQMEIFAEAMLRWNKKINVTAAKNIADVLDHCVDGIVASRLIPRDAKMLVDVGSGGGLPLVPMAIMRPDVAMVGVEPIAKKWAFILSCSRDLGLANLEAKQARVEELGAVGTFDVATSKATFEMARWLDVGLSLVKPNGAVLGFGSAAAIPTISSENDIIRFSRGGSNYWISRTWRSN